MATLYILYGSVTGNAEGIAKDLAEKKPPSHFTSVVCKPMGDFKKMSSEWEKPPVHGRKHGILIISSTTGNGDAPENASRFVRFIKRKQTVESQPFKHCAVAVLGLGDTNYDQFCETGRQIDRKMVELGAERAKKLVCADEATGLEEVVEPWLDSVFQDIQSACVASASPPNLVPETKSDKPLAEVSQVVQPIVQEAKDASSSVNVAMPSKSDSPLFIMYGSETGNAEQIAKDLAATYEMLLGNPDAHTFFPGVVCCDLNQFKKHLPTWEKENTQGTKHAVVIVTSTTGNGESPENASRFIRFIKRKQTVETQPFRHVNFSVLGLGDTNYDKFCEMGKEVDKKLAVLGGTCAKPLACADEGTGLEETVEPWTASILTDISNACRGGGALSASTTAKAVKGSIVQPRSKPDSEEEKKSESADLSAESIPQSSTSPGVASIKAMLGLEDTSTIPDVPHSMLPSLGASRSSCELFNEDYELSQDQTTVFADNATISTSSSDAVLYTQSRPYESEVVRARYLTKTSDDAAKKILDTVGAEGVFSGSNLLKARNICDSTFALDGQDKSTSDRNSKRVIELTLSLPDDYSLEYKPGDTIGLLASNQVDDVAFVLECLRENHGILPSQKVSIDEGHPITVEEAIREKVDLCCTLRNKKILSGLAQFATHEQDIAALRFLASKDSAGLKLFQEFIVDQRRSFADVLREFPSCRAISMEGLLGLLPAIPPRYYSISSSPLDAFKGRRLSIAFSVVDYLTPSLVIKGKEHGCRRIHGIATSFLEATCAHFLAKASDKLQRVPSLKIFPKATADFKLPSSLSTPIVMVGPGTGIAPFMGFLSHRRALLSSRESSDAASAVVEGTWRGGYELQTDDLPLDDKDSKGLVPGADYRNQQVVGDVDVYFGCRHADHDWLFSDEMKQYVSDKTISKLNTAFSRDANNKSYVQDLMKQPESAQRLVDIMLKQKGVLYICGDGNHMARDVQTALAEILGENDIDVGRAHIDKLKKEGRFLLDIWS
jgi:sulfite reductase alpha subunit-like flavoprotein